jgi:hypothetical protein
MCMDRVLWATCKGYKVGQELPMEEKVTTVQNMTGTRVGWRTVALWMCWYTEDPTGWKENKEQEEVKDEKKIPMGFNPRVQLCHLLATWPWQNFLPCGSFCLFIYLFIYFWCYRASHFLADALPLEPLCSILRKGLSNSLPRLASNCDPPNLCLPSGWDYRCEPQTPSKLLFLYLKKGMMPSRHRWL